MHVVLRKQGTPRLIAFVSGQGCKPWKKTAGTRAVGVLPPWDEAEGSSPGNTSTGEYKESRHHSQLEVQRFRGGLRLSNLKLEFMYQSPLLLQHGPHAASQDLALRPCCRDRAVQEAWQSEWFRTGLSLRRAHLQLQLGVLQLQPGVAVAQLLTLYLQASQPFLQRLIAEPGRWQPPPVHPLLACA